MNEQMLPAGEILKNIATLIDSRRFQSVYDYIDSVEPPKEWIIELPSKIGKETYKTIKLEVMEAAMKCIFGHCYLASISSPIISQDRNGKFCCTVSVEYEYLGFDNKPVRLPGIASVAANDITQLELATPKASSLALKNAIKQMGGLFGKYLNKHEAVEVEIPVEVKITPEKQAESILEGIATSSTLADLKSWRTLVYSKTGTSEMQNLYETKLRQLTTKK